MSRLNEDDMKKKHELCESYTPGLVAPVADKNDTTFSFDKRVKKSDVVALEALSDVPTPPEEQQNILAEENVAVERTTDKIAGTEVGGSAIHAASLSDLQHREETSVAEPKPNKSFVEVEVTTDGVRHVERFDREEVACLYVQQQAALCHVQGKFDIFYVPDWVRLHPSLGSYVAETFGTFACVLTLSLVSVRNQSLFTKGKDTNMSSFSIGFMFMCMVFTFGYISGGHFNPAITLAVFFMRKINFANAIVYFICQTVASLGAGLVAMAIQGSADIFVPHVSSEYVSSGIFAEFIFTFAIATVVLNVAYSRQNGNFFHGFAIGMTIFGATAAVGSISGGAFNPAAATGLQLALCISGNCAPLFSLWVYWLAPLVGSLVAVLLYSQLSQPEDTRALTDASVIHDNGNAVYGVLG